MARTKKEKVEFNASLHGEELKQMLEEAVEVKSKMQLYAESIKDIRTRAKEELGLEPKKFNALLKLMFNQSKDEFAAEADELIDLYDQVNNAWKERNNLANS